MLSIALIGLSTACAVQFGAHLGQRSAEAELLLMGEEMQTALQRYADATPSGLPRKPLSLQELVRDPRYPGVVRHLRRLLADPFTGQTDWVLIRDRWGRIDAVHSRSTLKTLKSTGFEPALFHLEGTGSTYDTWWFRGPEFQLAAGSYFQVR